MKPVKHFIHTKRFYSYNKIEVVVVICKNGKTEEISRGLNSSNIPDQRERLGEFQDSSSLNGVEQIRLDQVNSSGQDSTGATNRCGDTHAGKIVERLKLIEQKHLSYVKADQRRLEARLDESREEEESFKKDIQELEQQIYDLVSNQGTSDKEDPE
ncbi:MAG: hypothetical protein KME31_08535 [Tolypothrix carrinoi HA7290-LM1]|jgi:hypothetical protein|nr:hypothetical protein [Tolypothrix carrinoi HA7290-LM1]